MTTLKSDLNSCDIDFRIPKATKTLSFTYYTSSVYRLPILSANVPSVRRINLVPQPETSLHCNHGITPRKLENTKLFLLRNSHFKTYGGNQAKQKTEISRGNGHKL
ncbi:hypothetical protein C0J52_21721 [Blattella germanica]|nr:hypothetical protein C0J52_21721 [Blattella germanica]